MSDSIAARDGQPETTESIRDSRTTGKKTSATKGGRNATPFFQAADGVAIWMKYNSNGEIMQSLATRQCMHNVTECSRTVSTINRGVKSPKANKNHHYTCALCAPDVSTIQIQVLK